MDPGSAPQWIGQAHIEDQLADFQRHLRPAAAAPRLPSPEQAETGAMPTDNGLRLYDRQGVQDAWRNLIEAGENQTIDIAESEPLRRFPSQHVELLAQRQDFCLKRRS